MVSVVPVENTAHVLSLAPISTVVLAVGALLAFTERRRKIGTVLASSALIFFGAAFVL